MTTTITASIQNTTPVDMARLDKKPRKKRETKKSKLEKLGWDTSLSWSFPRFKKYISDPQRKLCSVQDLISFKTNNEDSPTPDGMLVTFERGPRIEQLCIINRFSANWITHPEFQKLIQPFTSTSKSSRFVLIHTEAKSWGKAKVKSAQEMLKKHLLSFSESLEKKTLRVVDLAPKREAVPVPSNEETEPIKLKIRPKKSITPKRMKQKPNLTIDTSVGKVTPAISSPNHETAEKYSEISQILVNFSDEIKKVTAAFGQLQKSLEGLSGVSEQIDKLITTK